MILFSFVKNWKGLLQVPFSIIAIFFTISEVSANSSGLNGQSLSDCSVLFEEKNHEFSWLKSQDLASEISGRRNRVAEFRLIREFAAQRGLRVWLFGGTAASFAHYVKWDLLRELGDLRFQALRFDYDYTNIFQSTQDLDIVVDGSAKIASSFESLLKVQFPYFFGKKQAAWEVRSLRESQGGKGGLLGDFGFMNQYTDSNSTGMIELTDPPPGESVVRDLRDWNNSLQPLFLRDVTEGYLSFYDSPRHFETPRFKSGRNPPIFSVIRALIKTLQFGLKIKDSDRAIFKEMIQKFRPERDLINSEAGEWIEKNGKKLFQNAMDLEYAWNLLEDLGLREKLISIRNNGSVLYSLAWWMGKVPLKTRPLGEGNKRTAESLGIRVVVHVTKDFLTYENITRSFIGTPNVFISRQNRTGEIAACGDGFYTSLGNKGIWERGVSIRFRVDPHAREGTDFFFGFREKENEIHDGDFIIWRNKAALTIIPESLDLSLVEYFHFLTDDHQINQGKAVLFENQPIFLNLKRRMENKITSGQISLEDVEEIRSIVLVQTQNHSSHLEKVLNHWFRIEGSRPEMARHREQLEALTESLNDKNGGSDLVRFLSKLLESSQGTDLDLFVRQKWIPSFLNSSQTDFGDRALEYILFADESLGQAVPAFQEFQLRALKDRESRDLSPFVRALKKIQLRNRDALTWLKASHSSEEESLEKASYLVLHPELRFELDQQPSVSHLVGVYPFFEQLSNIAIFEKLAGGSLSLGIRKESFQFKSYMFPPKGTRLTLGSSEREYQIKQMENQHEVTLTRSFEIQVTPVTQLQWFLIMGTNPSWLNDEGKMPEFPNRPVEQVTWRMVQKFIDKLNALDPDFTYRLPTEAEWEFAARAGTQTAYSFGDSPEALGEYGWYSGNSDQRTHDVASLKPNPDGLYDMHGNVWEWVEDHWQNIRPSHSIDPEGPGILGSYSHVIRGCSWGGIAECLRSSRRAHYKGGDSFKDIGFRLVRTQKK